jgi:hypothetical protein
MTTVMPLTMTQEMRNILFDATVRPPTTHEDRLKYAHATLTNIILNHGEHFRYFFNKPDDLVAFATWVDKKEKGELYTEYEMLGLKALNSCQIKYISLAIFKNLALDIFDRDQFLADCGVPKGYKPPLYHDDDYHDLPELIDISSDSDEE